MKKILLTICLLTLPGLAFAEGIINKTSTHTVAQTLDKLETIVTSKGFKVVARVNHAKAAEMNGRHLRPTELLIFGNPKVGSALMESNPAAGLDLPVKVLAWENEQGAVTLSYNDPHWMAARYEIHDRDEIINKMSNALDKFTDAAAN